MGLVGIKRKLFERNFMKLGLMIVIRLKIAIMDMLRKVQGKLSVIIRKIIDR